MTVKLFTGGMEKHTVQIEVDSEIFIFYETDEQYSELKNIIMSESLKHFKDKDNAEKMEQLKKDYTFHALKFEESMDRWFDLWRKKK